MFANLDKDRIPTGLLLDYAIDTIDLSDYDGSNLTDSTYVDRVILGDILNILNSASVEVYKSAQYWSDYADNIVGYDFQVKYHFQVASAICGGHFVL